MPFLLYNDNNIMEEKRHHLFSKRIFFLTSIILVIAAAAIYLLRIVTSANDFEITDDLGGNIFPSAILSTATTDTDIILPTEKPYLGNPKSVISIKLWSPAPGSRVRIEIGETPFFRHSVSEFVLPQGKKYYTIYPDMIWNYEQLRENDMAEPISVVAKVEMNGKDIGQKVRTFSVRSINECLIGYIDHYNRYHPTYQFFAAYVNEENPLIDNILREALNTRIVNRFSGYQNRKPGGIDKQVYALWNVLQKRKFRYSSISYSSLSSNVVFSQRVRTFDDALKSSQINCVDGSVLFASLLRAINIDPILVRIPGHMFVGYYTSHKHNEANYLETTMIGDIDLDDFFPEEKLDSTSVGKSQNEMSLLTFEKSKEYAKKKFEAHRKFIHTDSRNYMFLEISKATRKNIQPIGK